MTIQEDNGDRFDLTLEEGQESSRHVWRDGGWQSHDWAHMWQYSNADMLGQQFVHWGLHWVWKKEDQSVGNCMKNIHRFSVLLYSTYQWKNISVRLAVICSWFFKPEMVLCIIHVHVYGTFVLFKHCLYLIQHHYISITAKPRMKDDNQTENWDFDIKRRK